MMTKSTDKAKKKSSRIDGIGIIQDTLASRGGLSIFVKYLLNISLLLEVEHRFDRLRENAKGARVSELFKQVVLSYQACL